MQQCRRRHSCPHVICLCMGRDGHQMRPNCSVAETSDESASTLLYIGGSEGDVLQHAAFSLLQKHAHHIDADNTQCSTSLFFTSRSSPASMRFRRLPSCSFGRDPWYHRFHASLANFGEPIGVSDKLSKPQKR